MPEGATSGRTVDLVSADEVNEDIIQIASNQAMISSLLLAFTFVISGDQIDLGELSIKGNPICEGWKGYRAVSGDLQFEDECSSCQNIWSTCTSNDSIVSAIQGINFLSSLLFICNVCVNVAQIQLFARLPKAGSKALYKEMGKLLNKHIPNLTICSGLVWFIVAFFLQASLVMPPEGFVPIAIAGGFLVLLTMGTVFAMNRSMEGVKNKMKKHAVASG